MNFLSTSRQNARKHKITYGAIRTFVVSPQTKDSRMIQLEGQTVIAKLHNQETRWVCEPKKEMKGFQFLCNSSGFFISLTLNASPNGWYLSCKYIVDIKLSSGPSNSINSYIWARLMLMCVWILKEYLLHTKTKL